MKHYKSPLLYKLEFKTSFASKTCLWVSKPEIKCHVSWTRHCGRLVVVNGNYNHHNYLKTSFNKLKIKLCYFDYYHFLIFIFWTVNVFFFFLLQMQICNVININSHVTKLSCDWTDFCPLILLGNNLTAFSYSFTVKFLLSYGFRAKLSH